MNYKIYQVNTTKGKDIIFRPWEGVKKDFSLDKYDLVFDSNTEDDPDDILSFLENLFTTFNIGQRPADYKGRSLSVSDVVIIYDKFAYYCDTTGWKSIALYEFPKWAKSYIRKHGLGESLLYDSGTLFAKCSKEGYEAVLKTVGDVRILFSNDGKPIDEDRHNCDIFKTPSKFPDELRELIENGQLDSPKIIVGNNNWFEIFFYRYDYGKPILVYSDFCDADGSTYEELKEILEEELDNFKNE